MSLLDPVRQGYVKGWVVDKYGLRNGHLGMVIQDDRLHRPFDAELLEVIEIETGHLKMVWACLQAVGDSKHTI